jgi:hypothetical protein
MHKFYLNDYAHFDDPQNVSFRPEFRPSIVWEDMETERLALPYARSGQPVLLENAFWNVDRDKSKLRERLEKAGFTFEPIEQLADGSHVYRIYKPRSKS